MKITKIAWLGHKNYGDDLMAQAMQDHLKNKFGRYREYIWCDGNVEASKCSKSIFPDFFLPIFLKQWVIWWRLWRSDALIIGGGSILHSVNSIRWKMKGVRFFKIIHPKRPAVGVSLSLGPFKNQKSESDCRELFQQMDAVSVRDEASYRLACSWNQEHKIVRSIDVAGAYLESYSRQRQYKKNTPLSPLRRIGVSLVAREMTASKEMSLRYLVTKLSETYAQVVLLNLCNSEEFGDEAELKKLAHEVGSNNVEVVSYNSDVGAFTNILSECDFIVGERLHSIIASFFLKIPFISLSYHEKCRGFFDETGLPKKYLFDSNNLDIDSILKNIEMYDVEGNYSSLSRLSMRNFDVLDALGANDRS